MMLRRRYFIIRQMHAEELIRTCKVNPESRNLFIADVKYWISEVNGGNNLFFRPMLDNNFSHISKKVEEVKILSILLTQKLYGLDPLTRAYLKGIGRFDTNKAAKVLLSLQEASRATQKHIKPHIRPGRPKSKDRSAVISQLRFLITTIEGYGGKVSVNNPRSSDGGSLITILSKLKEWGYLKNKKLFNVTYNQASEARSQANRRKKIR